MFNNKTTTNSKLIYNDSTSTGDSKLYYQDTSQCSHLLPCGVCMLTFRICPKYNETTWELTCMSNIENK